MISLDGTREVHDMLRGVRGAYDRALAAIKLLRGNGVSVGVSTVMTPENVSVIPRMIVSIADLVDSVVLQPVHPYPVKADDMTIRHVRALVKCINEIRRARPELIPLTNEYLDGLVDYFEGRLRKICDAARLYFSISPTGDVCACALRDDIVLGNAVREGVKRSLSNISSRAAKLIRECPGCWINCTVEISLSMMRPIEKLSLVL